MDYRIFMEQETDLTQALRKQWREWTIPDRRTWERRLAALPASLPGSDHCFGCHLVEVLQPWGQDGKAASIDSTMMRAKGGVWHKKDRGQALFIPPSTPKRTGRNPAIMVGGAVEIFHRILYRFT